MRGRAAGIGKVHDRGAKGSARAWGERRPGKGPVNLFSRERAEPRGSVSGCGGQRPSLGGRVRQGLAGSIYGAKQLRGLLGLNRRNAPSCGEARTLPGLVARAGLSISISEIVIARRSVVASGFQAAPLENLFGTARARISPTELLRQFHVAHAPYEPRTLHGSPMDMTCDA